MNKCSEENDNGDKFKGNCKWPSFLKDKYYSSLRRTPKCIHISEDVVHIISEQNEEVRFFLKIHLQSPSQFGQYYTNICRDHVWRPKQN